MSPYHVEHLQPDQRTRNTHEPRPKQAYTNALEVPEFGLSCVREALSSCAGQREYGYGYV